MPALLTLYVSTENNAGDGAIVCICLLDRSFIVNQHKEQSQSKAMQVCVGSETVVPDNSRRVLYTLLRF